jgi:hypothetical protein
MPTSRADGWLRGSSPLFRGRVDASMRRGDAERRDVFSVPRLASCPCGDVQTDEWRGKEMVGGCGTVQQELALSDPENVE